jgi:branched-chain amino acid transport system permease protein
MIDRTHTAVLNQSNATSLRDPKRLAVYALIAAIIIIAPYLMPNSYWLRIYSMTGLWVMLALGLNVVAGFAGLLDLAYVAFFGIGGYTFALLSSSQMNIHLPFIIVLPLAAFFTMVIGIALGLTSIRLKGDYLAIVTLAFAQISSYCSTWILP